jgi:type III restriction enzyme
VELPDLSALPEATRKRFEKTLEVSPVTGSMTLRGDWSRPGDQKALKDAFQSPQAVQIVEQAIALLAAPEPYQPTPSERGERFAIPLLAWTQGDLLLEAGDAPLLESAWNPKDASVELPDGTWASAPPAMPTQ